MSSHLCGLFVACSYNFYGPDGTSSPSKDIYRP